MSHEHAPNTSSDQAPENYETGCVSAWLANDETLYQDMMRLSGRITSIDEAAEAIQQYVEALNPIANQVNLYTDLLASALQAVDWHAIAENFFEE